MARLPVTHKTRQAPVNPSAFHETLTGTQELHSTVQKKQLRAAAGSAYKARQKKLNASG